MSFCAAGCAAAEPRFAACGVDASRAASAAPGERLVALRTAEASHRNESRLEGLCLASSVAPASPSLSDELHVGDLKAASEASKSRRAELARCSRASRTCTGDSKVRSTKSTKSASARGHSEQGYPGIRQPSTKVNCRATKGNSARGAEVPVGAIPPPWPPGEQHFSDSQPPPRCRHCMRRHATKARALLSPSIRSTRLSMPSAALSASAIFGGSASWRGSA